MKLNGSDKSSWRVGQLAKAAGVSTDTLRHYERKGVLTSRRSNNGYREYPNDTLERVQLIRKSLAVGFTLDELSTIFKIFDRGGAPCQQVRGLAARKLAEIETHLLEVTALRDDLRDALKDWDSRLAKTTSGQRAGLLKALATRDTKWHRLKSVAVHKRKPERKKHD